MGRGRGQWEGGDREWSKREGEKKGQEDRRFYRLMDMMKCLGGHVE